MLGEYSINRLLAYMHRYMISKLSQLLSYYYSHKLNIYTDRYVDVVSGPRDGSYTR